MSAECPRIVLSGIYGRMGQALAPVLIADPRVELVGGLYAPHEEDEDAPVKALLEAHDIECDASPVALMNLVDDVDLWLDFSNREGIRSNLEAALSKGVQALIGVTGFSDDELRWLQGVSESTGQTIWWCPNFSLGMLVLNQASVLARRYFGAVEIIELHHDRKLDAPSGSAKHTAQLIGLAATEPGAAPYTSPVVEESSPSVISANFEASRGYRQDGIPIHAVRLPGMLAHEQIMFGGTGETLTIRHDTLDRSAFVEGIIQAALHLPKLKGFNQGLELLLGE